jgi:hypothetical protein
MVSDSFPNQMRQISDALIQHDMSESALLRQHAFFFRLTPRPASDPIWALCVWPKPQGPGPQRKINDLARCGPPKNASNQLEVLAAAISCRPSPPLRSE